MKLCFFLISILSSLLYSTNPFFDTGFGEVILKGTSTALAAGSASAIPRKGSEGGKNLLNFQDSLSVEVYSISFKNLKDSVVSMSSFRGKTILVAAFDAPDSSYDQLVFLDSLYKMDTANLQVIAVPVIDFKGSKPTEHLLSLQDSLSLKITMSRPARVKKNAATLQHPLFRWITYGVENIHFDRDIASGGEVFVISKEGTLYGVLAKGAPYALIHKVASEPIQELNP